MSSDLVLVLRDVRKSFGQVPALEGISLDVRPGELLVVVGPSGCGKTTLLRAIAGLTRIDSGTIRAGACEVAGPRSFVPPERREVGVVFQDLALFPHLDVGGNVAFGLARDEPDRRTRTAEVLDMVGLGGLGGRFPHELSGGERQRVALARALAPRPAVVLFDEPFSHLDRNLRTTVREHTVEVLRAAKATGVFVTHDQDEALAIGDRVAVMRAGQFEQVSAPERVFHRPANRFVATFLGEADFVPGERTGDRVETAFGVLPVHDVGTGSGPCLVMLRPHEVAVDEDDSADAVVTRTEFRGATVLLQVRLPDGSTVRGTRPHSAPLPVGASVSVRAVVDHPLMAFPV